MRKGITLIELVVVSIIIVIIASIAIPNVSEYLEESRISKCKSDLDQIKNALIRYELDNGRLYIKDDISDLIGRYLHKAITDPWGNPYIVAASWSVVYSFGPNRLNDSNYPIGSPSKGDDISVEFRPSFALSRVYLRDIDNTGTISSGDQIQLFFTRPVSGNIQDGDILADIWGTIVPLEDVVYNVGDKDVTFTIVNMDNQIPLGVGNVKLLVTASVTNFSDRALPPYGPNRVKQNWVELKSLQ